ncbi:tRNA epoxyqueuosine(34) reductase QueG [Sandaracinus amylolyticus]|uniref:Epoxyqueuosine (OQ) reductase QueG n=1 Tax=Sandaracinus amylolyticus TaxID=927083 RepID=A0A0F6W3S4_9BACT|nr:tRNA epoxyqueuosine(34) reductase QueG [Sandaracinus amylolyticus]AKF06718.1 Epoxyqueuosine (oQ) reductase QueG [Sandaracinus amylolyticus]
MTLTDEVKARARELGFARIGIARAEALGPEGERLRAWLAEGRHAAMAWMEQTCEVRVDPRDERMLAGARSVIVMATPYARHEERVGPAPGVVARYARGRDYHNVIGKRAKKLADWLRASGHLARGSTDSTPVFERAWAVRAGLGFIGKNCCLIIPGLGSHVLLATVVTTAELEPDAPMGERCGSCTRCLDACPTRAFVGPRELDARRCISYLTIEHEGAIDEALREGIGDRFLGCDVCQDVCPFTRTAPPDPATTEPFAPDARWRDHDAVSVLRMDEATFDAYSLGSPVRRLKRAGAARNAAIVLGNVGGKVHLPVLRDARERDADDAVRDAAAWAITRIESREK